MTCLFSQKGSATSLKAIDEILELLPKNIGLSINKIKNKIFFSKGCANKDLLKNAIGVVEGKLPTRYLGIPLSINYLKARNYSILIDKCREKIEEWMSSTIFFSGRLELIKTVLLGTLQYWI